MSRRGFTFAEVVIVIVVVALLFVIAIPSFQRSQSRSKISRARDDFRGIAIALEAYAVDNKGVFPYDGYDYSGVGDYWYNYWRLPRDLSTPVAYIESVSLIDPFRRRVGGSRHWQWDYYRYTSTGSTWGADYDGVYSRSSGYSSYYKPMLEEQGKWRLTSVGPDGYYGPRGWDGFSEYPAAALPQPYDPSNGILSDGDIMRTQINSRGWSNVY